MICFLLLAVLATSAKGYVDRDSGVPALTSAASSGDIERMRALIDEGADLDRFDWLGQTALHMAAKFQQTEAAKVLLYRGANCCIANADFQETPLHLAAKTGSLEIIQMLIDSGANVNAQISKDIIPGGTPLLYAALYDGSSFATAKLLMEHNADVRQTNSFGQTALHLYIEQMNLRAVVALISRFGTDPNLRNEAGCTALNVLAMQFPDQPSQMPIASYLLANGASVNSRCSAYESSRRTSLHSAVAFNNRPFIQLLLDYGADVNSYDRRGYTPLYLAVAVNEWVDIDIIKMLLLRGADPNRSPDESVDCDAMLSMFLRKPITAMTTKVIALLLSKGARTMKHCGDDNTVAMTRYLAEFFPSAPMEIVMDVSGVSRYERSGENVTRVISKRHIAPKKKVKKKNRNHPTWAFELVCNYVYFQ